MKKLPKLLQVYVHESLNLEFWYSISLYLDIQDKLQKLDSRPTFIDYWLIKIVNRIWLCHIFRDKHLDMCRHLLID